VEPIRGSVVPLLDSLEDLVKKLALPLPIVIWKLLGLPIEDREKFKEWSDVMVLRFGRPEEAFKVGQKYLHLVS